MKSLVWIGRGGCTWAKGLGSAVLSIQALYPVYGMENTRCIAGPAVCPRQRRQDCEAFSCSISMIEAQKGNSSRGKSLNLLQHIWMGMTMIFLTLPLAVKALLLYSRARDSDCD